MNNMKKIIQDCVESNRMDVRTSERFLLTMLCLTIASCSVEEAKVTYRTPSDLSQESSNVALQWADMTLYTVRFSAFNTPTYSSRALGYLGLAMYESIIPGDAGYRSMNGQLNGLNLPAVNPDAPYQWILSLNAAQHMLLKLLFPVPENSHRFIHERIDSLTDAVYAEYSKGIHPDVIKRSVEFGESIAAAIYDWSLTDGGDKGYQSNYDPKFVFPKGPSYWTPPLSGQAVSPYPLHPHWGANRTFVSENKDLAIPSIIPFSTNPSSECYKMYRAVYEKDKILSLEEKETAAWWGDDPADTFSPPGHSYYLAATAIKSSKVNIVKASEVFARVGMAVADAFIHCWKIKYTYFNERPSTYVRKYIDSTWTQYWPEPPFPAFPSGHSIHSAAAATVLTDIFGESFPFTDNSHKGTRNEDPRFLDLTYPGRNYTGFWDAADESAYSRFLGGIHTQQDNDVGQQEGKKVGQNVNALLWSNVQSATSDLQH
jgi:hypothetical protein